MRENRQGSLSLFNHNILRESKIPSICLSGAKCFFDTLKQVTGLFEPGSCYLNRGILPVRRLIFFFSP